MMVEYTCIPRRCATGWESIDLWVDHRTEHLNKWKENHNWCHSGSRWKLSQTHRCFQNTDCESVTETRYSSNAELQMSGGSHVLLKATNLINSVVVDNVFSSIMSPPYVSAFSHTDSSSYPTQTCAPPSRNPNHMYANPSGYRCSLPCWLSLAPGSFLRRWLHL